VEEGSIVSDKETSLGGDTGNAVSWEETMSEREKVGDSLGDWGICTESATGLLEVVVVVVDVVVCREAMSGSLVKTVAWDVGLEFDLERGKGSSSMTEREEREDRLLRDSLDVGMCRGTSKSMGEMGMGGMYGFAFEMGGELEDAERCTRTLDGMEEEEEEGEMLLEICAPRGEEDLPGERGEVGEGLSKLDDLLLVNTNAPEPVSDRKRWTPPE
jgi:hypothetical protein